MGQRLKLRPVPSRLLALRAAKPAYPGLDWARRGLGYGMSNESQVEAEDDGGEQELERPKEDTDPKTLACYGVLLRPGQEHAAHMFLRFVDGQPMAMFTACLSNTGWACS